MKIRSQIIPLVVLMSTALFYFLNPQIIEEYDWRTSSLDHSVQINFVEHFPDEISIELQKKNKSLESNYTISLCEESAIPDYSCPILFYSNEELKISTDKDYFKNIKHTANNNTRLIFSKDFDNVVTSYIYQDNELIYKDKISARSIFQGFFINSSSYPIDIDISITSSSRIIYKPLFNHLFITTFIFLVFLYINKLGINKILLHLKDKWYVLFSSFLLVSLVAGLKYPNLDDGWLVMQSDLAFDMFPLNSPNLMIWEDSFFQGSLLYFLNGLLINAFEIPYFYFFVSILFTTLFSFLLIVSARKIHRDRSYLLLALVYVLFMTSTWLITTRPESLIFIVAYIFLLFLEKIKLFDFLTLRDVGILALLFLIAVGTHQTGIVLFLPFCFILGYFISRKRFIYNASDLPYFASAICLGFGYAFWNSNFFFVLKSALWIRGSNPGGGHGLFPWNELTRFNNLYNSASFLQFFSVLTVFVSLLYLATAIILTRKFQSISILEVVIFLFPLSLTLTASKQPWHYLVLFAIVPHTLFLIRSRIKLSSVHHKKLLNILFAFIIFAAVFITLFLSKESFALKSSLHSLNGDVYVVGFDLFSVTILILLIYALFLFLNPSFKIKNYLLTSGLIIFMLLQTHINNQALNLPISSYFYKWKSFYTRDSVCEEVANANKIQISDGVKFIIDPINFWNFPCQNNLKIRSGAFDSANVVVGSPSMLDNIFRTPLLRNVVNYDLINQERSIFFVETYPKVQFSQYRSRVIEFGYSLLSEKNWK